MQLSTHRLIVSLIVVASTAVAAASHRLATSDLLRLVPPNSQLVCGISDPGKGSMTGRLLAATPDNNRDLSDILALTRISAADDNSQIHEVIVVAASFAPGDLRRHLLLLSGHLDATRIRQQALARGAQTFAYGGLQLLALPSIVLNGNRESQVRWIAILRDKIALVGTPALVTTAIDRWQQNTPADPLLLQRLAHLPTDVNSWSLVAMSAPTLAAHLPFLAGHSPFAAELHDADAVELGVRYGPMARIDFSIHQPSNPQEMRAPTPPQTIPSRFTVNVNALAPAQKNHHPDSIQGSVTVSAEQLNAWLAAWAPSTAQHNPPNTGAH